MTVEELKLEEVESKLSGLRGDCPAIDNYGCNTSSGIRLKSCEEKESYFIPCKKHLNWYFSDERIL